MVTDTKLQQRSVQFWSLQQYVWTAQEQLDLKIYVEFLSLSNSAANIKVYDDCLLHPKSQYKSINILITTRLEGKSKNILY